PAVAPADALVEPPADALRDAPLDLPGRERRIDDAPDFLHGHEIVHARLPRRRVDRHFGDVDGPAIGAIRVALVFLVVPREPGRRPVLAGRAQRAEPRDIAAARGLALGARL